MESSRPLDAYSQIVTGVAERLTPHAGEAVFDAGGHAVIPGLHDHHVHLHSAAAALTSVSVGPREVHGRADLARVLSEATVGEDGWYVAPTVLGGMAPDNPAAVQEIFGPVLSVLTFRDEAEAVEIANRSEYGLTAAVWTSEWLLRKKKSAWSGGRMPVSGCSFIGGCIRKERGTNGLSTMKP